MRSVLVVHAYYRVFKCRFRLVVCYLVNLLIVASDAFKESFLIVGNLYTVERNGIVRSVIWFKKRVDALRRICFIV